MASAGTVGTGGALGAVAAGLKNRFSKNNKPNPTPIGKDPIKSELNGLQPVVCPECRHVILGKFRGNSKL